MPRGPIVFFDIGSTLIEGPSSGPAQRFGDLLGLDKASVKDLREALFRANLSGPDEFAALLSMRFGVPRARALKSAATLWRAQIEEAYVLPGAREAVARLKDAGISRGYISNIWPPFYERFALEFPEEAKAGLCFLSFRTGRLKPDAAAFLEPLRTCGCHPSEGVVVGDTYANDIEPAAALGMKTVWVLHRPQKETCDLARVLNGAAPRPDLTLQSVGDLDAEQIRRLFAR